MDTAGPMIEPTRTEVRCREAECPHVVRLPVLGVMTTFATNSPAILDAIYQTFGSWAALRSFPELITESNTIVRIVEHGPRTGARTQGRAASGRLRLDAAAQRRRTGATTAPAFSHDVSVPGRMMVTGDAVEGVADTTRGEANARVAPGLAGQTLSFVEGVLEPLTLFLVGALDRQPLHGSAIVRAGRAIVLAGPSGAGKSTLTYAARSLGFTTLADEPVYVQLEPALRVWGRRSRLHLPVEARTHFPELRTLLPTQLPTGKSKIVIENDTVGPRHADTAALCIVRRGSGAHANLARIPVERAVAQLTTPLDPGYHLFAQTIGAAIARIAQCGAWELSTTDSPHDALPLLEEIAADLAQRC